MVARRGIEPSMEKQQGNRLALRLSVRDTRIFSRELGRPGLFISTSYRVARCSICTTMHDCAQLTHAKLTHDFLGLEGAVGSYSSARGTDKLISSDKCNLSVPFFYNAVLNWNDLPAPERP
jgi:hypothetical protein